MMRPLVRRCPDCTNPKKRRNPNRLNTGPCRTCAGSGWVLTEFARDLERLIRGRES